MADEYDLQRFVRAQDSVYGDAVGALRSGRMCTPHMELIFPRLASRTVPLGDDRYAIASLDEANAYLWSSVLGGRYRECVGLLQRLQGVEARADFSAVELRELHASLTLFSEASDDEFVLQTILVAWFDGALDQETMMAIDTRAG